MGSGVYCLELASLVEVVSFFVKLGRQTKLCPRRVCWLIMKQSQTIFELVAISGFL